jgi:hypothetical protein
MIDSEYNYGTAIRLSIVWISNRMCAERRSERIISRAKMYQLHVKIFSGATRASHHGLSPPSGILRYVAVCAVGAAQRRGYYDMTVVPVLL